MIIIVTITARAPPSLLLPKRPGQPPHQNGPPLPRLATNTTLALNYLIRHPRHKLAAHGPARGYTHGLLAHAPPACLADERAQVGEAHAGPLEIGVYECAWRVLGDRKKKRKGKKEAESLERRDCRV